MMQDLANYRATVSEPLWSSYRGYRMASVPPPASGISVIEALNILESFPLPELSWGSAATIHLLAEANKIVATDRRLVGGGPDWTTPTAGLASKAYAVERAYLIDMNHALNAQSMPDGNPYPHESTETTRFSVVDAAGNAVSNTYTLSASYGAHVVAPGTGFLLNDSMSNLAWGATGDDRKAKRPVPDKRIGSTITPLIVFRDDKPWLVTGTPGGGYIIATIVQLISNIIDHGLNVAEAAQRPRINQNGGDAPLELEEGLLPELVLVLALQSKGHVVRRSNTMGGIQSIMLDGALMLGSADTRRPDALAAGVR